MPAPNLTEIVATTLRNRERELADNVTAHNALLRQLERDGNIKVAGGGRDLTEILIYGEISNCKFYDGYEPFTVNPEEVADAATYDWKQLGGFWFISGKEKVQNRGKWAAKSLADARTKALKATLRNKTGLSLYSDGTGDGGKEFGGLRLLVADDPTAAGTVGGIDQSATANAWWRNMADSAGGTFGKDTIQHEMNRMWLACTRGTDQPNLILADADAYTAYWESLQANQRFIDDELGSAGFTTVQYLRAPVVYDAQCATDLTTDGAGRMYFLNTDYLLFRRAPGRWFSIDRPRQIENADYEIIPCWTMGNLTCNNRSLQGVIVRDGS